MPSYCVSCGSISKFIMLDEPLSIYSNYFEELARQIHEELMATAEEIPSFKSAKNPEEEQLSREIVDLRRRVRRCRNGLETTNLNRKIARLENELRRKRVQL